jgi:nucleotide-binding universal stress UspA family protein
MANKALDLWALTGARSDVAAPPIDVVARGATVVRRTSESTSVRPIGFFTSSTRANEHATWTSPGEHTREAVQNVVVALDSSLGAANVLSSALRAISGMPSTVLHVIHVFRASRIDHARVGVPATPAAAMEEAREEHVEARVCEARLKACGRVVGHFAVGDPTTEVLRLCRELKADLLIVGRHDHQGLERWLLGSIAETFVRKATCPVMVVRSRHDT